MSYAAWRATMRTVRSSTRVTWRGKSVGAGAVPAEARGAAVGLDELVRELLPTRAPSVAKQRELEGDSRGSASSCSTCRSPDATATPRLASMARGGARTLVGPGAAAGHLQRHRRGDAVVGALRRRAAPCRSAGAGARGSARATATAFQPAGSACAEVSGRGAAGCESNPLEGHSPEQRHHERGGGGAVGLLAHRDAVPHRSAASVLSYSV